MKNSFILYHSYRKHLSILTNEQKGVLLDAIFDYSENGTMPELEPILMMAFNFIQEDIDQNTKKWEETVEQRSEAGKKGAKARWEGHKKDGKGEDEMAKDGKRILPLANDSKNAVNVNDSVSVNDSVKENISKDIGKPILENMATDGVKAQGYGNADINVCIEYLKEKLGASLDGSVKENRQYCYNLLRKMKRDYPNTEPVAQIKMLIDVALQDKFHRKNITSFRYLFYNTQRIAQSFKSDYGIGSNNSDIQVI